MSVQQRSSIIQFVENGVEAWELLDDEIDRWLPIEEWADLPSNRNLSAHEQAVKFQAEVDSCKSECKFVRGRWLVPRFVGLERRTRHRQSMEIETYRGVDIKSAEQAEQVWAQMQQSLAVFKNGIGTTRTMALEDDPLVTARPEDQPTLTVVPNSTLQSIGRED